MYRVGFSSLYFKTHASAKMMRGVIETLDRDKFHIVVFALREPSDPPNPHPPKVVRSVVCGYHELKDLLMPPSVYSRTRMR